MEKQKRNRRPNLSMSDYIEAFKTLKTEIDLNPKVKTSKVSRKLGISNICVAKLKELHIINETSHGLYWSGLSPTSSMVKSVKSLFKFSSVKNNKKRIKGTSEPKNFPQQSEFEFKESERNIDHWNESIIEWNSRVLKQVAEKTDVLIKEQQLVDSSCVSDLIEYDAPDVPVQPKKEMQKTTTKPNEKIFEFKIFGFKFFTFKY